MRWLADECLHGSLVTRLRDAGHDVLYAAEDLQKTEDLDLADYAMAHNRLVLTEDRDFGRIVFRDGKRVPGIVYIRLGLEDRALQWPKLNDVIDQFGRRLFGSYVVIDRQRFRLRPLPEM